MCRGLSVATRRLAPGEVGLQSPPGQVRPESDAAESSRRGGTLADTAFQGVTDSSKAQRRVIASLSFPLPFPKTAWEAVPAQPHPSPGPTARDAPTQPGETTSWAETQEVPAPTSPTGRNDTLSGCHWPSASR